MPSTALAGTVLGRLTETFGVAGDPEQAARMSAYMRDRFRYLGLPSPARRELARRVLAGLPKPAEADLRDIAAECWALPHREYRYFGCDLLRRYVRVCSAGFADVVGDLIVDEPWWDTTDPLASRVIGPLVTRHPELLDTMDAWSGHEDMWLVRTAIIHQLGYRDGTDAERLFRYCRKQAGHPDFFVRKAIGWALRQYAYVDPEAVRAFVAAYQSELSPLSRREALRHQ